MKKIWMIKHKKKNIKKLENYLKPQKKDIVYGGIKASFSTIPGFGGVMTVENL